MLSDIKISNMALRLVGLSPIQSLSEASVEARDVTLYYDQVRQSVLRDHTWSFATKRMLLTPVELPIIYTGIWEYAFAYPSDALRIIRVFENEYTNEFDYEIAKDATMKLVLTNARIAGAEYTVNEQDVDLFDSLFVEAFSLALAGVLAQSIKRDAALVQQIGAKYQEAIVRAKRANKREQKKPPVPGDSWLLARYGVSYGH